MSAPLAIGVRIGAVLLALAVLAVRATGALHTEATTQPAPATRLLIPRSAFGVNLYDTSRRSKS